MGRSSTFLWVVNAPEVTVAALWVGFGNIYLRLLSSSHLIVFWKCFIFLLIISLLFILSWLALKHALLSFIFRKTGVGTNNMQNRSFASISTRDRSVAFSQHQCIVRESLCLSYIQMETFQHNSGANLREEFHFTYVSSHPKWHTDIPNKACDFSNGGKLHHAERVWPHL